MGRNMSFRQSSSFSSFVFGNNRNKTYHFSCRDLPLTEQAPACSAWPWQVQAGGAPVVALRQVSLGGKLRRQLEVWGEASSGLWRPPRRACPTASSFLTSPPSSRNPKHSPWQEAGRLGPRLGPGIGPSLCRPCWCPQNFFHFFTFIAKDIKARNTKKWRKKALFYGNLATVN